MTEPQVKTIKRKGSRFYVHPSSNEKFIGVTSVIRMLPKPFLQYWAAKMVAESAVENIGAVMNLISSGDKSAAKEAEALAARKKQNAGTNSPANSNANAAQKALEGLNLGGRRGNREIPKDVDVDRIRELFNRR